MSDLKPAHQLLVLDTLSDLAGSPEMLVSMLGTIEVTLGEDLAQLRQFVDAKQTDALGGKLHTLKGYIPMMCLPTMSEHLIAVETLARDAQHTALWAPDQMGLLLNNLLTLHQELQQVTKPS
jgi:chemotaxis protein histidine kinase CheA